MGTHQHIGGQAMLTGPEVLILCAILASLWGWEWWREKGEK